MEKHLSNREYVRQINRLIPAAEREARKRVNELGKKFEYRESISFGRSLESDKYIKRWKFYYETSFFHRAMNRLAREAGLRRI